MDDMEFIGESLTEILDVIREGMSADTQKEFQKLETNRDRIRTIMELDSVNKLLKPETSECLKSEEKAREYRLQGNALFQKRQYVKALEQYNLAVANGLWKPEQGPPGELVLALGNRSAVLAHRGHYKLSIENADLAIKFGYPVDSQYKLMERKGACYLHLQEFKMSQKELNDALQNLKSSGLEEAKQKDVEARIAKVLEECQRQKDASTEKKMKAKKESSNATELTNKNEVYNGMHADCSVAHNNKTGRGVVATDTIPTSTSVIVERPYASVLFPDYWRNHCYHCLNVLLAPYPCRDTSCFVYCGEPCETEAWNKYAQYEQHLTQGFQRKWMGTIGHLVLRTVLVTGLEKLLNSDCNVDGSKKSDDKNSVSVALDKQEVYSSCFENICKMESQSGSRAEMGIFDLSVTAIYLAKILQNVKFISEDEQALLDVSSRLMHLLEVVQCNGINVTEIRYPTDFEDPGTVEIGIGLYPTAALVNHSCDPNADVTCFHGNQLVVRAARVVHKGEPVTIAYRDRVFYKTSIAIRKAQLQFQYGFNCSCVACTKRWGKYEDLNNTMPQYRCFRCRSELFLGMIVDGTTARCEKCEALQDLQGRVRALTDSHDEYAKAMSMAVSGNSTDALPVLMKYLESVQKFLCPPWRELTTCQAAVQQCFRLQGNKRIID